MHDRRTTLQLFGALAAAAAMPTNVFAARGAARKPPRLRPGDTVGLIKPAGFLADEFDLQLVMETITAMGLIPKPAAHLRARHGYLAGQDKDRAADVNSMYADDSVWAVFAIRGGWGSARILPYLHNGSKAVAAGMGGKRTLADHFALTSQCRSSGEARWRIMPARGHPGGTASIRWPRTPGS